MRPGYGLSVHPWLTPNQTTQLRTTTTGRNVSWSLSTNHVFVYTIISGPITFAACLDFSFICCHGSDWLAGYTAKLRRIVSRDLHTEPSEGMENTYRRLAWRNASCFCFITVVWTFVYLFHYGFISSVPSFYCIFHLMNVLVSLIFLHEL